MKARPDQRGLQTYTLSRAPHLVLFGVACALAALGLYFAFIGEFVASLGFLPLVCAAAVLSFGHTVILGLMIQETAP